MQASYQFYAVIGGASATLLGLLFVVVSLNAAATLGAGHGTSRHLAELAFQNYMSVILVSLIALFPGITPSSFGQVTLGATALWLIRVLVRLHLMLSAPPDRESRLFALRRHVTSLIGFALLIAGALGLILGHGDGSNWIASATIVLLFSATLVSWELLGRIAKSRQTP
jgi:hypothetical protein